MQPTINVSLTIDAQQHDHSHACSPSRSTTTSPLPVPCACYTFVPPSDSPGDAEPIILKETGVFYIVIDSYQTGIYEDKETAFLALGNGLTRRMRTAHTFDHAQRILCMHGSASYASSPAAVQAYCVIAGDIPGPYADKETAFITMGTGPSRAIHQVAGYDAAATMFKHLLDAKEVRFSPM
ncbi:hypothetical protein CERSUDRAFT_92937 [Gelatoporia subvermispora B]|uniref:Uncharacterized protein n=1 Tax=Ceriporiopsis subvermispora (strain B) TaxID=914234 RepID=M2RKA0_CERS8|nr:hypothetical protein CERSUDRAFT_92937 [Gelatoporia subvermispora B]